MWPPETRSPGSNLTRISGSLSFDLSMPLIRKFLLCNSVCSFQQNVANSGSEMSQQCKNVYPQQTPPLL